MGWKALRIGLCSEQRRSGTRVVEYLGASLSSNTTYLKQVEHMISRVKQRLSRLHRIKRLSPHNACLLHSSRLVLLILDYADTVWVDKDNETKTKSQNWSALLELRVVQELHARLYSAYSFVAHRRQEVIRRLSYIQVFPASADTIHETTPTLRKWSWFMSSSFHNCLGKLKIKISHWGTCPVDGRACNCTAAERFWSCSLQLNLLPKFLSYH